MRSRRKRLLPTKGDVGYYLKTRRSFLTLLVSYPITSLICLVGRFLEHNFGILIFYGFILLCAHLAVNASLEMRSRMKLEKPDPHAFDFLLEFIPTLLLLGYVNGFSKDMTGIGADPGFLKHFGYTLSREVSHQLGWMGTIWTILIAYVSKYQWDAMIIAKEEVHK